MPGILEIPANRYILEKIIPFPFPPFTPPRRYLAFGLLAIAAIVLLQNFLLLRQSNGRGFAVQSSSSVVVHLSARSTDIEHVLLTQRRVLVEYRDYGALRGGTSD